MKKNILIGAITLLAGSLIAADASPKEDVLAAAKKLAAQSNYSWKATTDNGANAQFTPGPTEGKTDKGGLIMISMSFNDNTTDGFMKGTNVAVKTDEGWKTAVEATSGDGGFNMGSMMARRMQTTKAPAAEVEDLVAKAKDLKKDGDVISGELTEDGAKALIAMGGRRGGGQAPAATEAKGSVKFWIKDGTLTKYESKVSGKRDFNGEVREIERTVTVEIKDVGTTKITVPEEAQKKLS